MNLLIYEGYTMFSITTMMNKSDIALTEDLINKWNSLQPLLKTKYLSNTRDIGGSVAVKYVNDFTGLLLSLDVSKELIYPHIIANGLKASNEYDGSFSEIILLKNKELLIYYEMFTDVDI